jgi:predicted pyridoxine 5'-phosphate oxidase superfamily flavin-nucleotide-binding protein
LSGESKILTEEMKKVVGRERLGYAATVCPDGTPNLSPKGTTAVWDDRHLVFCDLRSPRTIANLRENPAIEVNVVDPIVRKGYRFKGEAEIVESGPRFEQLLDFYESRIEDPRGRVRAVVLIRVDRALPLVSPAYDLGLSENDVREHWRAHYCHE